MLRVAYYATDKRANGCSCPIIVGFTSLVGFTQVDSLVLPRPQGRGHAARHLPLRLSEQETFVGISLHRIGYDLLSNQLVEMLLGRREGDELGDWLANDPFSLYVSLARPSHDVAQ